MDRKSSRWMITLIAVPLLALAGAVAPQSGYCAAGEPAGAKQCCKVCSAGKACGDSCIAKDKVCHKGTGCACNG